MKNKNKVPLVRLFGIIAFAAVIVFSMAACDDGGGDGDSDGGINPQTATYTGDAGGTTYTLKITENTARYAAQNGDAYELTAGAKKSAGTVSNVSGGVLTLQPKNAAATFTANVSGSGNLTALTGTITYTDGEAVPAPGPLFSGEAETFTSIEALAAWLTGKPENTAATPYNVKLNVSSVADFYNAFDVFRGSKYINLDLSGSTLSIIPEETLAGCTSLVSIILSNSVTLDNYAFGGCSNLASINIPSGVTSIGRYVFSGCTNLANITIPPNVTSIGEGAFWNCTSLVSITIPARVTNIGEGSFGGSCGLTSVTFEGANTAILDMATFPDGGSLLTAYAAGGIGRYIRSDTGWSKYVIPTVTGVTVNPATTTVSKGGTRSFTATVTGTGNLVQTVTWAIVQTNKHAQTAISASGVLTVNAAETLGSLTIRATSTIDATKSGTATVTITSGGAGDNWLQHKITQYRVTGGVAGDVSSEGEYNWLIYRMTSNTDYEQEYTVTSTSSSGTYTQTYTATGYAIRNGQTGTQTQNIEQTVVSGTTTQSATQTYTITSEFDLATGLRLRDTSTQTITQTVNGVTTGPTTTEREEIYTLELLSNTGGVTAYKYQQTGRDDYTEYKFQDGREVERKEYNNGSLSYTEQTTYTDTTREIRHYTGSGSLEYTNTSTTVTIKPGLTANNVTRVYASNANENYTETVTIVPGSDTGSEVVVRRQRFNNSNVLTQQQDTLYRRR